MVPLPLQEDLTSPVDWNDEPQVVEFRTAFSNVKGTLGRNTSISTVTMQWWLSPDQIPVWIAAVVDQPLARFSYFAPEKNRWVVLRPMGAASYADAGLKTVCSLSFERLK